MSKKIALVTGGTRGIGAAISHGLQIAGKHVIANYAGNDQKAQEFSKETGISIKKFDVSDVDSSQKAIQEIFEEYGDIEILVNNAGITRDSFFHKMKPSDWQSVLNTNLNSMFNVSQPIFAKMRENKSGRIINISSVNGQKGQAGQTNYSAAKAGIIGFTKALAAEAAFKGITVNCICPGYINTDMVAAIDPKILEKIVAQIPAGRLGEPSEISGLVNYLVSDASAFMNGAILSMNGAQYMANG